MNAVDELNNRLDVVAELIDCGFTPESDAVIEAEYEVGQCMFRMRALRQAGCA